MRYGRTASRAIGGISRFALFIACFSFFILPASAEESWLLSTADFRTEQVSLKSIDDKGVHVVPAGSTKGEVIPPEQFLQLDRAASPVERHSKFVLVLLGGDRLGGEPLRLENDKLAWRNAAVGEMSVPLTEVAALVKGDGASAAQLDLTAQRTEDVVALSNGDAVRGIVTGMTDRQVEVKAAGADVAVPVPLESVVSIQFASTGGAPQANTGGKDARAYRVRLDDGSSVVGTSLTVAGDKLTLAVRGGGEPRPLPLASVVGIEQVNGPVSWLTSRTPAQDVHLPFVGTSEQALWRTRPDADVTGQPFLVGGRSFKRGIGVHSFSRLVYPLDGAHKAFRTRYGINDGLSRGDVTVRILVGGKLAHEKKNVKPGVLSPVVVVDLPPGAKELVLEADYGDGIDVEDRLNWLEPALLRDKPKPEPPPAAATTRPATTKPAATQPTAAR